MNLLMLLFLFWCFYDTVKMLSHNALHLGHIFDHFTNFEEIYGDIVTACPASTPKENFFNYNVSISEKSLFMRNLYVSAASMEKMQLNICETAFTPATIYDRKNNIYEIGYELYYEESRIKFLQKPKSFKYDDHMSVHFPSLVPFAKPSCDYVKKYEDNGRVKFKFIDGSETLAFVWIPALYMSVTTKSKTKQIDFSDWHRAIDYEYNPKSKYCDDYHHLKDKNIQYLFSEKNQEKWLKDLTIPSSLSTQNPNTSFPQHYGYLVKSFLIPAWFSSKHAYKLIYCTVWMNFVPVWKTIAQGQLRKVDVFVFLLTTTMRSHRQYEWRKGKIRITELSFGVKGVLKLMKKTDSEISQEIHLSDEENYYTIPVPKIIFKIIRLEMLDELGAVIIIHNNPTSIADSDRICAKESEVPGWNTIRNEDPRTGLTYTCPLTPEVIQKLQPNNFITFNHSDFAFDFEGCFPREAMHVNQNMEKLLRSIESLDET